MVELRTRCERAQVYARADVEAAGSAIHVPRVEMGSRAKLSCVAWNGYIKGALLAADYDGGVALWDAETAACSAMFEEHGKRVWSVDFSQVAPLQHACLLSPARAPFGCCQMPACVCW